MESKHKHKWIVHPRLDIVRVCEICNRQIFSFNAETKIKDGVDVNVRKKD